MANFNPQLSSKLFEIFDDKTINALVEMCFRRAKVPEYAIA